MPPDDDKRRRRPQPTEIIGGEPRSTEVLHSSRAVPLDAGMGMPPAPAGGDEAEAPAPRAKKPDPRDRPPRAEQRGARPIRDAPAPTPKRKSNVQPLPPEPELDPVEHEASGFDDPQATEALGAHHLKALGKSPYATGDESSYLRPLTAHVKLHDDSADPLRPRTEQRALTDGLSYPEMTPTDPEEERARRRAVALPPSPPPSPPPARAAPPPPPAPRYQAPVHPAQLAPPPATTPGRNEPDPFAHLPPMRVKARRRSHEVKAGRARTGVVLMLVLFGMLSLIGVAASRTLFQRDAVDEVTVAGDPQPADNKLTEEGYPAAWAPEPEGTGDEDDEEERDDDERAKRDEPEPEPEPAPRKNNKAKPRGDGERAKLKLALLGFEDESGDAKSGQGIAKQELQRALDKAGVALAARKQSPFGAQVVVERVKKKRKADALMVEIKCRAVVRALPGDEMKMSTRAEAAVSMSGDVGKEDERELVETGLSACVSKLAKDVAAFAKKGGA